MQDPQTITDEERDAAAGAQADELQAALDAEALAAAEADLGQGGPDDAPALDEGAALDLGENDPTEAAAAERQRRATTGKYVVLALDTETGDEDIGIGWIPLPGQNAEPTFYPGGNGAQAEAKRNALDHPANELIATLVREHPDRILLAAIPAASWQPAPARARVTQTTWVV